MRRGALLLLLLGAACSSNAAFIAGVSITGNVALSDPELRRAAETCADLDECRYALGLKYLEEGYLSATVTAEQSVLQQWTGSRSGTLNVIEGPRFTIGTLAFPEIGGPFPDGLGNAAELEALGTVHAGSPFRKDELRALADAILQRYDAAGWHETRLLPVTSIDVDATTISVTIEITRVPATSPTPP